MLEELKKVYRKLQKIANYYEKVENRSTIDEYLEFDNIRKLVHYMNNIV